MTIVTVVPIAASGAFAPILANLTGEASTQRQTTRQLALVQLAFTAIPAAVVAFGAPWATMLFGPAFAAAAPIIVLTMILAPVFVVNNLYWRALISNGRAWTSLFMGLTSASLMLAITWLGRSGGAPALVEAMIAANLVTLVLMAAIMEWDWRRGVVAPVEAQQART
jgi:O-antigen/teichoic acid export membrane protein